MSEEEQSAIQLSKARIAEAIAGKTRGVQQLTKVFVADVIAIASSIPEEKRTRVVQALLKGAVGAKKFSRDGDELPVEVFQQVDDLFHLLNAAGA